MVSSSTPQRDPIQTPQHVNSPPKTSDGKKPVWKTNAFIIFLLFVFWPVGLFLMWKYAPWRKRSKVIVTCFFGISVLPLLLFWSTILFLGGLAYIQSQLNPPRIDQALYYVCQRNAAEEWSTCDSRNYRFTVEYPSSWHFIESGKSIAFTPKANSSDGIIAIDPVDGSSEKFAHDFVRGRSLSRKQVIVNGLFAGIDDTYHRNGNLKLFGAIQDGSMIYTFYVFHSTLKKNKIQLTDDQLRTTFYHMFYSFKLRSRL